MAAINQRRLLLLKSKLLLMLLLVRRLKQRKPKSKRKYWVCKIYQDRREKGEYHLLVKELRIHDREYFFRCFRMSPILFEELLSKIAPHIVKEQTRLRDPISAGERLCVTLRYLVTGDAHVTIGASYRMSPSIIGQIIPEICTAIWDVLSKDYIKVPTSEEEVFLRDGIFLI